MKSFPILAVACFIQISANAQNPNPSASVDDFILSEMQSENAPGMSTLIVKGGEIVWVESYGFADVENAVPVADSTVFMLASVSKVFTGTALMQLHQSGVIDLDLDINNYLPFDIDVPNFESDSITTRMLMTHSSSIADNDPVLDTYYSLGDPTITLSELIEQYFSPSGSDYSATENFNNNAPGTAYAYSNLATALAGYIVESASGMDFSEYCNQHIFNTICMQHTSWYFADFDSSKVARPYQWNGNQYVPYAHYGFADYPDGQLRSNVLDLANFLITYLQGGSFHSQALLSGSSVSEMLSQQIPSLEPSQGLNWYTEEVFLTGGGTTIVWGHNGGESGVSTDIYIDPTTDIGIVVLSNGEGDNLYVVDELYNYALSLAPTGVGNPPCEPAGISEATIATKWSIYPNPSNGLVHIKNNHGASGMLTVFNALGQVVISRKALQREMEIDLENAGVYYVQITSENQLTVNSKIVVL
ncbi:MAG: serine hydrolase [Flavobacteriales bacterium]|nr:serine hydrolase [Flavobacteriales bacterium]